MICFIYSMKCVLNINNLRNVNFKASITNKEIDDFKNAKQYYSDCYLMTTLESLSHIENGRKILKEHIKREDSNSNLINCYLYTYDGKKEKYTVPTDVVIRGYKDLYKNQKNEIIRSMDISFAEYENRHKSKPWVCRFTDNFRHYEFENNAPSNFMKVLTGVEPTINIAEKEFNIDLTSHKDEVMELFKKIDKDKDFSLVIGTGLKPLNGHSWHVYILEDVDLENDTITVKEKRSNKPQTISIDKALNSFKFIVGYFNKDLEQPAKESQQ